MIRCQSLSWGAPGQPLTSPLSIEFDSGSLKGVSVMLQVNNVTNSPYATINGTANGVLAPELYQKFGRQYLLGVNYKL